MLLGFQITGKSPRNRLRQKQKYCAKYEAKYQGEGESALHWRMSGKSQKATSEDGKTIAYAQVEPSDAGGHH